MDERLEEIKLTTETFDEAGGLEIYPDLELVEPLGVKIPKSELTNDYDTNFKELNRLLKKKAYERGFEAVFKIEYMDGEDKLIFIKGKPATEAIGNGYRIKDL